MGSSSSGKKRPREDGSVRGDAAGAAPPADGSRGGATVGQQTSHIKNKLVRAEAYAKLKHKHKVRPAIASRVLH
jgi:hypothetical protein